MSTYQAEHADGERCREAELNRDCPRHHTRQPVSDEDYRPAVDDMTEMGFHAG